MGVGCVAVGPAGVTLTARPAAEGPGERGPDAMPDPAEQSLVEASLAVCGL